jgi:hypothetical protein
VLGPVIEPDDEGNPRHRVMGSYGETKNGHSVILKLVYGKFSVLFGGDLNTRAEKLLLANYGGRKDLMETQDVKLPDPRKKKETDAYAALIEAARKRLQSEVFKVCHHGASDVTDAFIEAVNPASFVISSGDEENYVHPRPDLLGRLGRLGRGEAPVLLSTELQRSTRASEEEARVKALRTAIDRHAAKASAANKRKLDAAIEVLARDNVDVYGAIYLKTDGERLITAFKYESPSDAKKWFHYEYRFDSDGELHLVD